MKTRQSREDQVVTLGNCFICLNPCSKSKIVDETCHSSLNQLCRHLDIKINSTEVKAIICEKCDQTLGMISEHLLLMEVYQMKVNFWLGQVEGNISKTKESFGKLIEHYDAGYVEQFKEVVGLREAIFGKCRLMTSNLLPRISLSRVKPSLPIKLIKTEEEAETDITDNQFDNGFENNNEDNCSVSSFSSSSPSLAFEGDDSSVSFSDTEGTTDELENKSTRHTCNLCDKSLATKRNLHDHIKYVHKTVPKHKCGTCGKLFKFRRSLQQHKTICRLKVPSNPDYKYACNLCDRRYNHHQPLRYHKLTFHNNIRKYKCDICSKSFKASYHLSGHKRAVHDRIKRTTLPCEIEGCSKSFRGVSTKWAHMMEAHNLHGPPTPTAFQVKYVISAAPSKYADHFTRKTEQDGKVVFQCNYCKDKSYKQFSSFTTHYQEIHVAKANGYSCTCHICGKNSANDKALRRHIRDIHETEPNVICDACGKSFKEVRNMYLHKESCSSKPAPNPDYKHACDLCNSRFKTPSRLSRHKHHAHSDVRNYKCDICSKSFKASHHLTGHKRAVHDNIKRKRFSCEIEGCSKSFKTNSIKWLHMNKEHNFHGPPSPPGYRNRSVPPSALADHFTKTITFGTKTYQCNHCEETMFKTLSGFIAHYKAVHVENKLVVKTNKYKGHYARIKGEEGQEIIKCQYCDKEYKSVKTFSRHYKIVHLKLTIFHFQCETCGVTKDRESLLKLHIAKEHAIT